MEKKAKIIIISVIVLVLLVGIIWALLPRGISEQEKREIDEWIEKNNLNEFGDPADTMYLGGTPLFDVTTGETIDRYDYILKNNPDRPWRKK